MLAYNYKGDIYKPFDTDAVAYFYGVQSQHMHR